MSETSWLVLDYQPLSLFTLKQSNASSKFAISHLLPTPLAIKVAFMAAGFQKDGKSEAKNVFNIIKHFDITIKPPSNLVLQRQTVKVLQPSRSDVDFDQTVIMREFSFMDEELRIAIKTNGQNDEILTTAPYVRSLGSKDSMFQFSNHEVINNLPDTFGKKLDPNVELSDGQIYWLDDFTEKGKNTDDLFARVNVYSSKTTRSYKMGTHRDVFPYSFPVELETTGSSFHHYKLVN